MELPFKLKQTKEQVKSDWERSGENDKGLIATEEEFESIYYMYIYSSHCELCNKEFKSTQDRQMDHNHETGEFRNILCNLCNIKRR